MVTTYTPQQFGMRGRAKPDGKMDCTSYLQKAFEAAVKAGGEVYLSPGIWRGNVEVGNVEGVTIRGDSSGRTLLRGADPTRPALKINGLWYSTIRDLGFGVEHGLKDCAVLEVDRGSERGVQANCFERLSIGGQGTNDGLRSRYAVAMCRAGNAPGAIGAQGSEQIFYRCHLSGASEACYYQVGYNALTNTFLGGNIQMYDRCGIELIAGNVNVHGVGFQSCTGYEQVANGGWDIKADSGGVGDPLIISGCRTESLRFYKGGHSQPATLIGCLQAANPVVDPARPFEVVNLAVGTIANCYWLAGGRVLHEHDANYLGREVCADYVCTPDDHWVFVDARKDGQPNNVTISLCNAALVPHGRKVVVTKAGEPGAGEVTVSAPYLNNGPEHSLRIDRSATFMAQGSGYSARRWYQIA